MTHWNARHAFVLRELFAVILVTALVLGAMALGADHSRRHARLGDDLARLRQLGVATGHYAADSDDRFWTFSWRAGIVYQNQYPDLNISIDDLQAAANQCVYLL